MTSLILASASPRRAAILRSLGLRFSVRVSGIEEALLAGEDAATGAERLAREKAAAVPRGEGEVVLAADTIVTVNREILGKPGTPLEATRMLRLLSGREHEVVTGVCLLAGDALHSGREATRVRFLSLSEAQIEWYVATGEPLDKAGAYHVDGMGAAFVESVTGSPSNVEGLPVVLTLDLARRAGLTLGPP